MNPHSQELIYCDSKQLQNVETSMLLHGNVDIIFKGEGKGKRLNLIKWWSMAQMQNK